MTKWEDDDYKYKHTVDTDKGRVTVEKIGKTGKDHSHEWQENSDGRIKYGYRGENASKEGDSSSSSSSSGWCFITTACVEFQGLSVDCRELTVLREFRNSYILRTPEGREAIEEYNRLAPQLVAAIRSSGNAESVFSEVYSTYVLPAVELVERGHNEEAYRLYSKGMVDLAKDYLGTK